MNVLREEKVEDSLQLLMRGEEGETIEDSFDKIQEQDNNEEEVEIIFRPNVSLGPLRFMFVSYRSFKFLRFQIGSLSFEFVSDRSFLSTSVKPTLFFLLSQS